MKTAPTVLFNEKAVMGSQASTLPVRMTNGILTNEGEHGDSHS